MNAVRLCSALVLAFLLALLPAAAQTPLAEAETTIKATVAEIQRAGARGIAPHVPDLEKALTDGAALFPPRPGADGKMVMPVSGSAEALAAMVMAANRKIQAVTVDNPYPIIGLLLMQHYIEARQPLEALRVQAAAMKLRVITDAWLGPVDAMILTEAAAAHLSLRRWDDGLAAADAALKAAQNNRDKARSQRTRGFALIEMQRLDDAEAAYRESLALEPNNPLALNQLAYIARQRAGGGRGAPTIVTPNDPTRPPATEQLSPPPSQPATPPT